jgi:phosphatidylserine/phosphatidylglycerophosphate/cardiolipin synthase-like enzyme
MFIPFFRHQKSRFDSKLFDQTDFYGQFIHDLNSCKNEVIIESPFITSSRMNLLYPTFKKLLARNVHIHIITRDPIDHDDEFMRNQSTNEILCCNEMGINIVLLRGNHHRKIAILDRNILWEGSLNILSYSNSQEIMRRIENKETATQMFNFLRLQKLFIQR